MVSPDEINQFFQNLTPEQQQKAQASGAYQEALATGNIAPLQPYLAAPSSSMTVEDAPAPSPEGLLTGPTYDMNNPEGIITARPHGGSYGTYYEGGVAQTNDDAFYRYLSAKYRQSFIAPEEGRPVTYSQARSYLANLARPDNPAAMEFSKTRAQELEHATWVSMGRPDIYPDTATSIPQGAYTRSQWEAGTGLSSRAFTPGTEENRALNEGRLKLELSPDFLQRAGVRPENVPERLSQAEISRALARGDSSGVDTGPGIRGETSEEAGARFGRQMGAIGPQGPMGAPAPAPAPAPDTVFPSGLADTEIKRAALGNMFGLGAPVAEGFADTDIKMAAIRQNLAMGGMSVPLAEIARPVRESALGGSPAEGFEGKDILMTGGGLATLRAFGESPAPAMAGAALTGAPIPPPAMGTDFGSFYYPFAGLGVLGREVQNIGEGIASYMGRAGKTWIEGIGGIRPESMPLPSEISADAKKFMEGGITKTETFTIPYSKDDPINRLRESMGLEQIKEAVHTKGTYTPFVDAEVTVRGEAGKGAKETFTEMLAGPPDPFRYITNIGPVKLPFKIGPIGRNEKVPLASEAYRLRAAPGVFTREVGSAVGLGIVKPVGQGISALENPLQAGMAAPAVALAFGVGLAMLPGQIAMTTALNPAAGAGQVYGLVAPFSLAGKLRGARFDAKPTADIQFPGYSEGGVLLEVSKRGPIAGHVDLGGVVASRIMGRPVRSTVQVGEGGVFEIPLEWIDRPVVGGKAVSAEGLLRGLEIERRFNIRTRLADEFAVATEEMVGKVPRSAETVDVFRLGRTGEAEIEMFGDYFVPATREGTAYVKGAPKDLFKPVYETVKMAEPWMKGTKRLPTYVETVWTDLGEPGFREWKISPDYPTVRPQTLLEKITRRPAEDIKLVPQKRLLGFEATMSRETSGRLGEFMLGKTSPKGAVIRPSQIEIKSFEPLEGLTPKEIGAEATYGARGAPANLGLAEGAKAEPVFLGGIGARAKATYTIKPEQFGQAPKALEKFGLKSSLKGERLEVEFGGVKGQPSLYDTPVGMKAVGGTIKIRPGLAEQARGRVGSLMEKIRARGQAPISVDFPRKVRIPGPGDRFGTLDYVAMDKRLDVFFGGLGKRAPAPRAPTPGRAGLSSMMRGATLSDVYGNPQKSQTVGEALQNVKFPDMTIRRKKTILVEGEEEGVGVLGLQTEIGQSLAKMKDSGFRFYTAPGSRSALTMPRASLRGASLGLGAGALSLRDKIGTSEVMVGTQRESTRLLDVLAERTRPTQTLRMPGVLEHERERVGVDVLRLERDKVTPVVGQFQHVGQRQQVRVAERVGQIERQVTVQKVEELLRTRIDTGGDGGGGGPPPPDKTGRVFPIPRLGGFAMPRGSFKGYRPSLKITPIATLESMFSFGGGAKRGGRKATGTKRGRPKGSKTKKRGGRR